MLEILVLLHERLTVSMSGVKRKCCSKASDTQLHSEVILHLCINMASVFVFRVVRLLLGVYTGWKSSVQSSLSAAVKMPESGGREPFGKAPPVLR